MQQVGCTVNLPLFVPSDGELREGDKARMGSTCTRQRAQVSGSYRNGSNLMSSTSCCVVLHKLFDLSILTVLIYKMGVAVSKL